MQLNAFRMKFKYINVFLLIIGLISCKNENEKRQVESIKDIKKKEVLFSIIEKAWVFNAKLIDETSRSSTLGWNEWRSFLAELNQKPKKPLALFRKNQRSFLKK